MFLSSAHRDELEDHCDDDWRSHLVSTRSLSGLQRHLLFLSVEALPTRREVLHWDLHSPQVVPAFEWVLGVSALFRQFFAIPSAAGSLKHISPFVASILHLHWFFENGFPMRPSCVWSRIGQMARHSSPERSRARVSPDSSQWRRCGAWRS